MNRHPREEPILASSTPLVLLFFGKKSGRVPLAYLNSPRSLQENNRQKTTSRSGRFPILAAAWQGKKNGEAGFAKPGRHREQEGLSPRVPTLSGAERKQDSVESGPEGVPPGAGQKICRSLW